jgi:hypothetical protein
MHLRKFEVPAKGAGVMFDEAWDRAWIAENGPIDVMVTGCDLKITVASILK